MDNFNNFSRRGLIGAGAGLAASATLLGSRLGAAGAAVGDGDFDSLLPIDRIGLQMYSVRNDVSAQGFDKTFAKLAEIGYKHVEFAGYTDNSSPAITVKQLRALLDKYGLKAAGSHVSASDEASMKKILDDAEVLGIPYVGASLVTPGGAGLPPTAGDPTPSTDGWKVTADQANKFGEIAAKRGMKFYLHNHFQEWAPCVDDSSKCGHDVFLENLDPRFAFLELDIYWCYVGSAQNANTRAFDPLKDYILKHNDRYALFHVKDGIYDAQGKPTGTITDVGEGKIDFQKIFTELFKKSADEPSKHLYLWENDDAGNHPRGSLAAAQSSYANMRYSLKKAAQAASGGGTDTGVGSAVGETVECVTATGLTAAVNAIRVTRSKTGKRSVGVALKLNGGATVAAKLTRNGKTLAKTSKTLAKGRRSLKIAVPRKTKKGQALLTLTVKNAKGTALTVRRVVHI